MVRSVLLACVLALAAFSPSRADVLLIERAQASNEVDLPRRGELMNQVEARFGAPSRKHPPVGGASEAQPPITRWDYPNFSVYFEHSHVVDAVLNRVSQYEKGPKAPVSGQ